MVFLFPKTNEKFFGNPEIFYTVVFGWILLAAFLIALTLGGSYNFFDPVLFRLTNLKTDNRPWYSLHIIEPIADGFSLFIPWVMIVIYVITFLEIRFKIYTRFRYGADSISTTPPPTNASKTKKRGEIRILLQCFIICSVFQIEWAAFNYLPKLPKLLPFIEPYVNTMTNIMTVCMNTVHSIVIFTFTTQARTLLKNLFTNVQTNPMFSNGVFLIQKKPSIAPIVQFRTSV
uniref:G-protein coupled receptors family 1 profile domain-containing protein n=1 Tax=Panagrolaimus davidi TaxID=227884 RepID=A0A914PA16_9BILA